MPVITMPDGVDVEFPDDMPRERISAIIKGKFPDAVKQAAAPDDHGLARRKAMTPLGGAVAPITEYWPTQGQMANEGWEQAKHGAGQLAALPSRESKYTPESTGQAMLESIKGVGNVAAGALGYVASPISAAYRSFLGQPVEDVTGIPREYTEFGAQLATPGIGFTRLPGKPGAPVNPAEFRPPSETTVIPSEGQEVAAAANRLSETGAAVQVPKAVATDNMAVQRTAATARNVPLAGDPLIKSAERTLEQLGTKADEVAAGYGGGTVEGAGEAAGGAIKNWITGESKTKATQLYDRVDNLVDQQSMTPLVNTRGVAAEIAAERAAAHLPSGKAVDVISEAAGAEGLTYQGIKTLRTKVGEAMDSGILPEGMSGGDLKRIYGALTDDLRSSVLVSGGPKAVAEFDRANRYYKLVSDRRESLAKIVGEKGDVPVEKVFDRLRAMATSTGRADHAKLAQARKTIGAEDWNEFASGVAGRLGRDVEGNFSPARFITDYEKLSEAGKTLLFKSGGKGELAQHLDDIAKVSSRFKELQKFANPSGTSQQILGGGIGAGIVVPLLAGDVVTPLKVAGTVLGARTLSYALSRPATAASLVKLSRAQEALTRNPSPARVAAYATAARNLLSTLGDKAQGITVHDFMRSLQGPVPAGAENEQR